MLYHVNLRWSKSIYSYGMAVCLFWRLEMIRQIRRTNEVRTNGEVYGSRLRKEVAGKVRSLFLHAPSFTYTLSSETLPNRL